MHEPDADKGSGLDPSDEDLRPAWVRLAESVDGPVTEWLARWASRTRRKPDAQPDGRRLPRARTGLRRAWLTYTVLAVSVAVAAVAKEGALHAYLADPTPGRFEWYMRLAIALMSLTAVCAVLCLLMIVRVMRIPVAAALTADRLVASDEPHDVVSLADGLGFLRGRRLRAAHAALIRLLPCVDEELGASLDASERCGLRSALRSGNPTVVTALLGAVARIGDVQALPAARRLADGKGACGKAPEVREAARICVEALEARAAAAKPGASLVRAAHAEPELLRPAPSVEPEAERDLLRATAADEETGEDVSNRTRA